MSYKVVSSSQNLILSLLEGIFSTAFSFFECLRQILRGLRVLRGGGYAGFQILIVVFFGLALFMPQSSLAQVTLSGVVYSDAGTTPQAVSKTISVAVGTSSVGRFSTTTAITTGAWTVTIPAGHGIATGTPILVWIDNDAATRGSVLTKSNSSATSFSITGLDLYRNRVIARHEATSGTSTTNTDFGFYTAAQDADLQHSTTSAGVTIAAGNEMYVWAGKTLAPGGNLTIAGNASTSATDGSLFLASSSVYVAGGTLSIAGSLRASSTATIAPGNYFVMSFNASTTGKVIDALIPTIGNVIFNSASGTWTFSNNATTSDFKIISGSVTVPSGSLSVTGVFANYGTFVNNNGTFNAQGALIDTTNQIVQYIAGRDGSGSATGTQNATVSDFAVKDTTLYVGGPSTGLCTATVGSTQPCELIVYSIASSTNPIYITGRDSNGSAVGTSTGSVLSLAVNGNSLFVTKINNATACSQIVGSAEGCELMVFDISSSTNPIYVAGRDASGNATGTENAGFQNSIIEGNYLYVGKSGTTAVCSQAPGSAAGCELMVFDISSSTNPTYVAGRDGSGSAAGTSTVAVLALEIKNNYLYVGKNLNGTACSQTAGSAVGCELMVFDISSLTNPIYVAGRDASGNAAGTSNISVTDIIYFENVLYVTKAGDATACSQTAGSAVGCELMVFDISSSTNPTYVAGRDAGGSNDGILTVDSNSIIKVNNYLYTVNSGSTTACSQVVGSASGCEFKVYDVASSTNPIYVAGRDASGNSVGTTSVNVFGLFQINNYVYVGKNSSSTACSQTAGSAVGCELMVFDIGPQPAGVLQGNLVGANTLNQFTSTGTVLFRDSASTTNFVINSGTTTAPRQLTVSGNYTNNGVFLNNSGTVFISSTSAQTLSGAMASTSTFADIMFIGVGTKTLSNNASTSNLTIVQGTVVAPSQLTIRGNYTNNGTFTAGGGSVTIESYIRDYLAGRDVSSTATGTGSVMIRSLVTIGNTLYVGKAGNATACSQVAGAVSGCELMVFDISSTTNPLFLVGRDITGSATGTGTGASLLGIFSLASMGNTLYVGTAGSSTACSQVAGAADGCELMVFDISSTTNPTYVAGRDTVGNAVGTSTVFIRALSSFGNVLYVGKTGDATACSQIAGSAVGCELMVFDISSTTNPVYVAGRDASGNATGTASLPTVQTLFVTGSALNVGKSGDATACSQIAGSAVGCELMVFDISSTTNPVYVAGRDASGNATGTGNVAIQSFASIGTSLYVGKSGIGIACSSSPGSAVGCELMVFDISSTTNPLYLNGLDSAGNTTTVTTGSINSLATVGNTLYIGKGGDATACSQVAGAASGCEVMAFDVASTTNPVYVAGLDSAGNATGTLSIAVQAFSTLGANLFIGKAGDATACSQVAGAAGGCELMGYNLDSDVIGNLNSSSALNNVAIRGSVHINSAASTSNVTIDGYFTAPSTTLSVAGNFTNNGTFAANNGRVALLGTNQTVSANAITTFYDLVQIATTSATTTFSTNTPFVVLRTLNLQGVSTSSPLRLRSISNGSKWRIDPYATSTITLSFLDVQDSNNISATATPLVCGAGCRDSGNNTNWTLGLQLTISGIVYAEDGATPYATATPIRLVVPLATNYFQTATSATSTGVYSLTVSDSFLATNTPYFLFADNAAAIKANTIVKSSSTIASIAGLNLFRNHVIVRSEGGATTAITNADLARYTSADDTDIRYGVDTSRALTVTSPAALVVWDNSNYIPGGRVTVAGNASTTITDGSMYMRSGATYVSTNKTTIAGSLRASSTASITPNVGVIEFNATTTGKVIDAAITTLGNTMFNGTGGAWSFTQANATTSDFDIERGTVTAPSGVLTVNGLYMNNGTFTNNSGTVKVVGNTLDDNTRAATYVTGIDNSGNKTGTQLRTIEALHVSGNYLYRGLNAGTSACSQTLGNSGVSHCEIAVFDISSTTNPVYVAGRDSDGSASGTSGDTDVQDLFVSGNYLYVVKTASSTPCSQSIGAANGCELMVFDISSSTNPVYVAGRDGDGSATGSGAVGGFGLAVVGQYLYMTKLGDATGCSQIAGSAIGCELMVFSISDPANPTYVAGRDVSGSSAGIGNTDIRKIISGQESVLYTVKGSGDATGCSQIAGSAIGCELMVFSIASATNPVYVAGRDADGSSTGTDIQGSYGLSAANGILALAKTGNATACSQIAGSATGCELMIYDISSSTNPVYRAGRDVSGDSAGTDNLSAYAVKILGNNLIFGKFSNATACSQVAGSAIGCEIMVFDISSTTNPLYIAGRDSGGDRAGVQGRVAQAIAVTDSVFYIGKNGQSSACSQIAGSAIGCELMVFSSLQPAGVMSGQITNTSAFSTLETSGLATLVSNASTTNITVSNGILTPPTNLSLSGNFTNNGVYVSAATSTFTASSSATQTFAGTATSTVFGDVTFRGAGTKNFGLNATATNVSINTGATVSHDGSLTMTGDYTNSGTFTANSTSDLMFTGENPLKDYIAGRDVSGSATGGVSNLMGQMVRNGSYLYIAKGFNAAACSQAVGSAAGCELLVYDVSSSTNHVYVAGRDSSGNNTGTGAVFTAAVAISGNYLYLTKGGDATACSQTAGSANGCELMVFDISSSTNPVYVAGRDASGNSAGTGAATIQRVITLGSYLYAFKNGDATACSQTAGSAIGCELMVFNIASATNPVYISGRDASGNSAGTGSITIIGASIIGNNIYITKNGDATACSQTAGSAVGCELMVFDISSSTDPVYVAGRDASGNGDGVSAVGMRRISSRDTTIYLTKEADATACSQTAGSAVGCELMVFDISSSTDPVYVAGRDASGNGDGIGSVQLRDINTLGNNIFISKDGNATACSQTAGSAVGCELMVFNISSSTNPIYVAGQDASGSNTGTLNQQISDLFVYSNSIHVTKGGDATACSQTAGSAVGCEFMTFNFGSILRGNMVGSNAQRMVTVKGPTQWYDNASTTNLVITSTGVATAPNKLTLAGNYTSSGEYYANNGEVILSGNDQTISSVGTTTFYDLIDTNTVMSTTMFSTSSPFIILRNLMMSGSVSAPLKLRSTNGGSQWKISPQSSTTIITQYLDVQDSNNVSTVVSPLICGINCIDSGNNTNWSNLVVVVAGSSTIANHTAGQVANTFTAGPKTNESLFAFRLTPNSGTATVTDAVISLSGVQGFNPVTGLTNLRLFRDLDNDALYDATDTQVGGAGAIVGANQNGTLTFTTDFLSTTSQNYLVVGDWSVPADGSFITFDLFPSGLSIIDATSSQSVFGSVSAAQHSRNNRGAGGRGAGVGGDAPAGNGTTTGGVTEGGEQIGDDPDFYWPNANSGSWNSGANAYDRIDGTYATTSTAVTHSFTNAGFAIPGNNTIGGIEVKLELGGTSAEGTINVELSWNGGAGWTTAKTTPTLTIADTVRSVGAPADLWGRTWTASELNNTNFVVRLTGAPSANTIRLDAIQIKVYHAAGGGGAGGGGGGGI